MKKSTSTTASRMACWPARSPKARTKGVEEAVGGDLEHAVAPLEHPLGDAVEQEALAQARGPGEQQVVLGVVGKFSA